MGPIVMKYRGRDLTADDIRTIRELIDRHFTHGRTSISQRLCDEWAWFKADGNRKEYAARDLLLRLEEKGFIQLPPRLKGDTKKKRNLFDQVPLFEQRALTGLVSEYPGPRLTIVEKSERSLWDYLVYHYHYLNNPLLVGEHLKYFIWIDDLLVGCIGWSSAAWRVRVRDELLGWSDDLKRKNLHLVVNNSRFLVLPWIRLQCLASKVLAMNVRRLCSDWMVVYHHPVYLAETFVDQERFRGTCYKAANWRYVGQTSGSAKKGNRYHFHGSQKAIFLYPLHKDCVRVLHEA